MTSAPDRTPIHSAKHDEISQAALRGALSAFTKPTVVQSRDLPATPSRTSVGEHQGRAALARRPGLSRARTDTSNTLSQRLLQHSEVATGPTASNIAALTASFRSVENIGAQRQTPAVVKTHIPSKYAVARSNEAPADVCPVPGTVDGLRGQFESIGQQWIHSGHSIHSSNLNRHLYVTDTRLSEDHSSRAKPQLAVNVQSAFMIRHHSSTEIQSPTPLRALPAVIPIEASVGRTAAGTYDVSAMQTSHNSAPEDPGSTTPTLKTSTDRELVDSIIVAGSEPRRDAHHHNTPIVMSGLNQEILPVNNTKASGNANTGSRVVPSTPRNPTIAKRSYSSGLGADQVLALRVESLANAIVGAQLASSRASSPGKMVPFKSTSHVSEDILHPEWPSKPRPTISRTPSPKKTMRHTLREPQPTSEPEKTAHWHRERSRFHLRKHPNKHHEGNRKRWRDEITEDERRRYEGVWAANRDLFDDPSPIETVGVIPMAERIHGCVSGLVVRDIWTRSRLTLHDLEEIWNLVDKDNQPRLSREEFVVGMWLIDQRLKGRKLPVKVGDSVWHSVRGIYGLKVPKFKGRDTS